MSANTTHHLIADMERLREHLGIERWLLYGGSWGSTLILAYAERYPERVSEVVILGVTMTRRSEIDWLYRGVGRFFPAEWDRFRRGVPEADRDGDLVAAYARLLESPDADVRVRATRDWLAWEDAVISLESNGSPGAYSDRPPDAALAFVRICTHYFSHGAWLEEGELLAHAGAAGRHPGRAPPRPPRPGLAASALPGSWHRRGRDPSSSSSTTPATPAATRCASSRCRRQRVSASILVAAPQAVTAVTTPATNATASVSRRNVAAGRRRPRLVPIAFATRTPGSHHRKARPASLLS